MYKFTKLFISLFGIGFFPIASGTIATLISLIFMFFIIKFISIFYIILFFIIIFFISTRLINYYSSFVKNHDSSEIVIDEFLGIIFIFIFYDFFKFTNDYIMLILIFFIFRFFDIIKIFPANWVDKNIKNSWGVLLDDIIAGGYSIIVLFLFHEFV